MLMEKHSIVGVLMYVNRCPPSFICVYSKAQRCEDTGSIVTGIKAICGAPSSKRGNKDPQELMSQQGNKRGCKKTLMLLAWGRSRNMRKKGEGNAVKQLTLRV